LVPVISAEEHQALRPSYRYSTSFPKQSEHAELLASAVDTGQLMDHHA
jgi:hypothetical protein